MHLHSFLQIRLDCCTFVCPRAIRIMHISKLCQFFFFFCCSHFVEKQVWNMRKCENNRQALSIPMGIFAANDTSLLKSFRNRIEFMISRVSIGFELIWFVYTAKIGQFKLWTVFCFRFALTSNIPSSIDQNMRENRHITLTPTLCGG